jgi:hypothetical protein
MSVLFGAYSPSCSTHAQVAAIIFRWDSITPYRRRAPNIKKIRACVLDQAGVRMRRSPPSYSDGTASHPTDAGHTKYIKKQIRACVLDQLEYACAGRRHHI